MGKKVVKSLQDLAEAVPLVGIPENTETVDFSSDSGPSYDSASREEIESVIASLLDETVEEGFIIPEALNVLEEEASSGQIVIDIVPTSTDSGETYVAGEDDPMNRDNIISELHTLYTTLKIPYIAKTWENMETLQLYDLLSIVRKDAGGSVETATLIQKTKEDFEVAISSDMMKSRLKIIDQKSADYAKVAQRMSALLGSDVVINGARTKEYHEMVRDYVKYIVTLTQKINSLAQFFNITIPIEEEFPNGPRIPIMEEMPCSPMNAVYILNVIMATLDRTVMASKFSQEALERANSRVDYLETQLRNSREQIDNLQKAAVKTAEEHKRLIGNASYWIIKDQHGRILQKIDPDKRLETPADLDLHGTIDTALFITTERSAEILVQRLSKSRRFRKFTLNSYRVSIVQQTFNETLDSSEEVE